MQHSDNRSNDLDRRGAMKVAGAAMTAAAVPTTGVALAQSTERDAAVPPSQERRDSRSSETLLD
jgi:hypothetical protein